MRHTLEQLKAMTPRQLSAAWLQGQFPFDHATTCHQCITTHRSTEDDGDCKAPEHAGIRQDALRLGPYANLDELFENPAKIEELYALRLFYDHLYPQPIVEETHAEVLVAEIERQKERIEESYLEMRADLVRGEEE